MCAQNEDCDFEGRNRWRKPRGGVPGINILYIVNPMQKNANKEERNRNRVLNKT